MWLWKAYYRWDMGESLQKDSLGIKLEIPVAVLGLVEVYVAGLHAIGWHRRGTIRDTQRQKPDQSTFLLLRPVDSHFQGDIFGPAFDLPGILQAVKSDVLACQRAAFPLDARVQLPPWI